jgi:hypothetical protein
MAFTLLLVLMLLVVVLVLLALLVVRIFACTVFCGVRVCDAHGGAHLYGQDSFAIKLQL